MDVIHALYVTDLRNESQEWGADPILKTARSRKPDDPFAAYFERGRVMSIPL